MDTSTLVIDPAVVAKRFGLTDPTDDELDRIADAIRDAQSDVEGELNRSLIAETVVLERISPYAGFGINLTKPEAWPDAARFDDWVRVESSTPYPDGTYDVTFSVGLDGKNESPIVRFVTAHAVRALREDEAYGFPLKRVVNNVSADGQSLTYVARPSEAGAAGSLPTMKSLRRYKRLAVFKRNRAMADLWPNRGGML